MATGDQNDIFGRLNSLLPSRWFVGSTPIKDAVMTGIAAVFSQTYGLYAYAKLQTRISTLTDGWIDTAAADYFGTGLTRNLGESDAAYLARVKANLLAPRTARPAMVTVLARLTGRVPTIWEPNNPADMGAMNAPKSPGYCGVARFGSMAVPFNALILAFRPMVTGQVSAGAAFSNAPKLSAMNTPLSQGYTGSLGSQSSSATDAAIYAAVNATRPAASVVGVSISN